MATYIETITGSNVGADENDTPTSSTFATLNAGDTVIVAVSWETTDDNPTVYDTGSRTYNALTKRKDPNQNQWLQLFWYRYTSGASNQYIYIGNNATAEYKNIIAARFSGMAAGPFSSEAYNTSATSTSVALSSALSIGGAGVIFGACKIWNTEATMTAGPTGFTLVGPTSNAFVYASYKTYTDVDSATVSFTGPTSSYWVISAAAFLDSGSGAVTLGGSALTSGIGTQVPSIAVPL